VLSLPHTGTADGTEKAMAATMVVALLGMRTARMSMPSEQPLDFGYEQHVREKTFQKLAPAHAVPALPDGRRLSISLGSLLECDTGGRVWPSATVLCKWLIEHVEEVQDARLLELGCGTGCVGLHAAALGARRVALTDGGSESLLALAAWNERTNRHLWSNNRTQVHVQRHKWGEPIADTARGLYSNLDWIVASDVTYATHAHGALCDSITAQLRVHSPGARVLIAHQHRVDVTGEGSTTGDTRLHCFTRSAEAVGLSVRCVHTESVNHGGRDISLLRVELR
jgi:predicted nicotinamide N-methyase